MLAKYIDEASKKEKSKYTPPEAVRKMTAQHQKDYQWVYELQRKPFREFNDMNVLDRQDLMQRVFNTYEEAPSQDPDEEWKWNGVKPTSRNKTISIAAHLISSMLYPNAIAQDQNDKEDKGASEVMRSMIMWNIDNSDYEMTMLYGTIASAVNPCAYVETEYIEMMQTVRDELENGDVSVKEVIDQVLSGIQVENIPMEEVMPSNFYIFNHQRQPFVIRRRYISFADFQAKYADHSNKGFVKAGVQVVFSENDTTFYEVEETTKDQLVEEVTVKSRVKDIEVTYVNGVYFGKKNTEANKIKHRRCVKDKFGQKLEIPVYNEVKWGYEPIDEKRFYYYKSLVDKLYPDQRKLDRMSRLAVDGTVMATLPALITTGAPKVDASVVFPAAVTAFPKDATITPVNTGRDLNAVYNNILETEKTISESSQDNIRGGITPSGGRTAYEIARVEQNAIIKEFSIFGRMVGSAVEQIGELMVDLILKHQTIGEVKEITQGIYRLEDLSYSLPNETVDGKKVTKKVVFTDRVMGTEMTEDELLTDSYKKLDEAEKTGVYLYETNPVLFADRRYRTNIEPDQMMPRIQAFEEERNVRARQLMMTSPYVNAEAVDRDFLFDPLTEGQSDKYMKKADELGITGANSESNPVTGIEKLIGNNQDNVYQPR